MKPFTYQRPTSVDDACQQLGPSRVAYGGGTDLLPRIKAGLAAPSQLVDLKHTGLPDRIVDHGHCTQLGALTTLAAIERDTGLADRLSALPAAARQAATPQIRNRATIAGNLVQRPRCWYYRSEETDCWLKGGTGCPAREGRNEHHAIFDRDRPCVAVHPSDLAGVLVALDAIVHLHSNRGHRTMPIGELYTAPTDEHRAETTVRPDEFITEIEIVTRRPVVSSYRKAMDRAAWAFALVGVAVVATFDNDRLDDVRIVATGVANTPRRLTASEEILLADGVDERSIERAATAATVGSEPLSHNRYKQQLLTALTRDAMIEVTDRR